MPYQIGPLRLLPENMQCHVTLCLHLAIALQAAARARHHGASSGSSSSSTTDDTGNLSVHQLHLAWAVQLRSRGMLRIMLIHTAPIAGASQQRRVAASQRCSIAAAQLQGSGGSQAHTVSIRTGHSIMHIQRDPVMLCAPHPYGLRPDSEALEKTRVLSPTPDPTQWQPLLRRQVLKQRIILRQC